MSTEEENKVIFRRYIEGVFNQGNLEVANEIFDRYVSWSRERRAHIPSTARLSL